MYRAALSRWWAVAVAVSLVVAALFGIASTYGELSQTYDEGAHLAAGMEWLDRGRFTYEVVHPPLARVAVALGPWLDGLHSVGLPSFWDEGNAILHQRDTYQRNLTLARLGTLPFFLLACFVVWAWGRRLGGRWMALTAVLLFTTLPPILGHAGVAALDLACAAMTGAGFLALVRWLERPTAARGLVLGLAVGAAATTKFTALFFIIAAGALMLPLRWAGGRRQPPIARPAPILRPLALAAVAVGFTFAVWAPYRFGVGPLSPRDGRPHAMLDRAVGAAGPVHDAAYAIVEAPVWPIAGLVEGLLAVPGRNEAGHKAFLLGEVSEAGRSLFYPVALLVKTPLPFLLLVLIGIGALAAGRPRSEPDDPSAGAPRWERWAPLACVAGVFVVAMQGNVNAGGRQILAAYAPLTMFAAMGVRALWELRPAARTAALVLLLWQMTVAWAQRPDYLAYFNELAGERPEDVLVQSDLDWGQDLDRLADTLRARGVDTVHIAYNGSADITRHELPALQALPPYEPVSGWVAISLWREKGGARSQRRPPYDAYDWLEAYEPLTRIGESINLYFIPPKRR